ncbi:hypothetical protein DLJ54_04650 [Corynebacterium heidelbergense]|uniref:Uncharacterized protein n=2 Tax=Corynebacterium heidelbergense TaxID=2055947 RepID=A0A364V662_9CORY|nr:hypothetical protein DLJ54_04650 [Corynebacterium heidelbergense]
MADRHASREAAQRRIREREERQQQEPKKAERPSRPAQPGEPERFPLPPSTSAAPGSPPARDPRVRSTGPARSTPQTRRGRWWATWGPHVRRFAPPLAINHGVTLAVIAAIAVIIGISRGFSVVPAAIGSMWMATILAPIKLQGAELGFLPMLPAAVVVYGYSRRITKILGDSISIRGLRAFVALALAIPVLLTLVAWFMIWDASSVYPVAAPNLAVALISALLVNGAAVGLGMRSRIWRALLLRRGLPTWPVESFRLATSWLKWMAAAGALGALAILVGNLGALTRSYGITDSTLSVVGLTVVGLVYLPNILIGAIAVLLGGEFSVGNGSASLFGVNNVNLPSVPVLAAVPNHDIPGGALWLAIPAAVTAWTLYRFLRHRSFIEAPIATAAGAGAFAGFLSYCIAWLSGGELGVFGQTGPLAWLAGLEAAAWLLLPGVALMAYLSRTGQRVLEDVEEPAETGGENVTDEGAETADDSETTDDAEDAVDVDEVDNEEADARNNSAAESPAEEPNSEQVSAAEDADTAEESDAAEEVETVEESPTPDSEQDVTPPEGTGEAAPGGVASQSKKSTEDEEEGTTP